MGSATETTGKLPPVLPEHQIVLPALTVRVQVEVALVEVVAEQPEPSSAIGVSAPLGVPGPGNIGPCAIGARPSKIESSKFGIFIVSLDNSA